MSKINIKIVEVEQSSHSVSVKYTSDKSKKLIDEYPAVVFQATNFNVSSPEEFIEAIRPQISLYVHFRDLAENPATSIDLSNWIGCTATVDSFPLPATAPPPIEGLSNPEIIL
jgi:hypothetical protein